MKKVFAKSKQEISITLTMSKRQTFTKVAGTAGIIGLAGCDSTSGSDPEMTFGGDNTIDFAISPSVPQKHLQLQYAPFLDHVESYLKTESVSDDPTIEGNIGSTHSAVIQSLDRATTDIAETGPFAAYSTPTSGSVARTRGFKTHRAVIDRHRRHR